jgi:2-iminobutanoate/2-iminopropanoate deaminase
MKREMVSLHLVDSRNDWGILNRFICHRNLQGHRYELATGTPVRVRPMSEVIDAEYIPGPPGLPFSTGVRVGEVLYLSGELGTLPDGSLSTDFNEQSRQVMENVARTLQAAGSHISSVFKTTVMLADIARWAEFNEIYLEYFDAARLPARTAFATAGLAFDAHVEVECWAYLGGQPESGGVRPVASTLLRLGNDG